MTEYIKWMERNPKWLKLVLCIWVLDWSWAIWRILKAVQKNSIVELILGIVWILWGGTIGWLFDVVSIILTDYPFWFK